MLLALLAIGFTIPGQLDAQSQKAATQSAVISLGQFQDYDLTASHNNRRSCDDRDRDYKDRRYKDKKRYNDRDNCGKQGKRGKGHYKKKGKGHYKGKGKGHQKHGCNSCDCSCGCGHGDDGYYGDDDDDYYGDDDDEYGRETRREREIRDIIGKRRDDRKYERRERRDQETDTERREREIKDILGKKITTILIPGN